MGLVVEAWEVRLRDEETGRVVTRELRAGAEWPCESEEAAPTAKPTRPPEAPPAKAPAEGKPKESAAPTPKAESKPAAPKAKVEERAAPAPKAEPKPKSPAKPKAEKKSEAKARTRRDLSDPKARARFDGEVLKAVRGGARTVRAIGKRFKAEDDADLVAIVAALQRLVEAGKVVQTGTGSSATFTVPAQPPKASKKTTVEKSTAPEPPKPDVLPPAAVELGWTAAIVEGHAVRRATFEGGIFQLTRRLHGLHQLTYEKGERFDIYGCGEQPTMEALAEKLATAGVPTPDLWVKSGGNIEACARITRLGGLELEWRETVDKGSELCVAATSDGEFRIMRTENGSFALVFLANGDDQADTLGCGTREALEARALDVLGQVAAPPEVAATVIEEVPAPAPESTGTPPAAPGEDITPTAEKDAAIMGALKEALKSVKQGA